MVDKVQKIRKEVERIQLYTQSEVLKQVLDYIDEVQKEPVSEDLEEAAEDAMQTAIDTESPYTDGEGMSLYPPEYLKSLFIEGAQWQKQKMMAKAFDAEVLENYDGKVIKYDDTILDEKLYGCKVFDKVKVILI